MTDDLSPRARALLDAARGGLGPDDAAIARMRAKVLAGTGGAAATAASSGIGMAGKLTLVAVIAAVGAGGAWLATHRGARATRAPAIEAPVSADPPVHRTTSFEMAAPPELPAAAPPSSSANATHHAHVVPDEGDRGGSLADEVALVDAAMAAMRKGDAAGALDATDRHAARFGRRGQLGEEAAALRVEALCRLGDARADAAWTTFADRWPDSTQGPRIVAACRAATP